MRNGRLTSFLNKFLSKFNREIILIKQKDTAKRKLWLKEFLFKQPIDMSLEVLAIEDESKSQYKQDLFVLTELNFKRDGFFVEFGATNGVDLSNTHILEKRFNWKGILSEPARGWHSQLKKNRDCHIEMDCVWKKSNEKLDFFESRVGVLSTIDYINKEIPNKGRKGRIYKVNTITLNDMLKKHNAPKSIDYLSIDTEGSEYEILKEFDFSQYDIKIITIEYNENRNDVHDLLTRHNYERKYTELSECDDWYVKR